MPGCPLDILVDQSDWGIVSLAIAVQPLFQMALRSSHDDRGEDGESVAARGRHCLLTPMVPACVRPAAKQKGAGGENASAGNFKRLVCGCHASGIADWDLLLCMETGGAALLALLHGPLADARASAAPHRLWRLAEVPVHSPPDPRP